MPSEQNNARQPRLKWCFRPWCVTLTGVAIGAICFGLWESGSDQIQQRTTSGHMAMIMGGFGGAFASVLADQLLSRARPNVSKRWPKFSVGTLLTVLTLVCLWFGSWEALRDYAVEDIIDDSWLGGSRPRAAATSIPYVVAIGGGYCVWFFGVTLSLELRDCFSHFVAMTILIGLAYFVRSFVRRAALEIHASP